MADVAELTQHLSLFVNESGITELHIALPLFIQSHLKFSNRLPNVPSNQGWLWWFGGVADLCDWTLALKEGLKKGGELQSDPKMTADVRVGDN